MLPLCSARRPGHLIVHDPGRTPKKAEGPGQTSNLFFRKPQKTVILLCSASHLLVQLGEILTRSDERMGIDEFRTTGPGNFKYSWVELRIDLCASMTVSQRVPEAVPPARPGVQNRLERLDCRLRGRDGKRGFPTSCETVKYSK